MCVYLSATYAKTESEFGQGKERSGFAFKAGAVECAGLGVGWFRSLDLQARIASHNKKIARPEKVARAGDGFGDKGSTKGKANKEDICVEN